MGWSHSARGLAGLAGLAGSPGLRARDPAGSRLHFIVQGGKFAALAETKVPENTKEYKVYRCSFLTHTTPPQPSRHEQLHTRHPTHDEQKRDQSQRQTYALIAV